MPAEPEAWETTEEPMKPEEIERLSSESRTRRVGTKRRYFSTVCLCIRGIVSVLIGLCHVFLVDETLDFWSTRLSIDITVPGKGKANKGAITGWADLDGDAAMPRIVRRLAYGTGVCLVVWGIFCVFTVFKVIYLINLGLSNIPLGRQKQKADLAHSSFFHPLSSSTRLRASLSTGVVS